MLLEATPGWARGFLDGSFLPVPLHTVSLAQLGHVELLPTGDQAHCEDNCLYTPEGPFSDSTHCPPGRTGFTSAAEPQEECMFTLCTLQWVILIIKVQNILLRLEAKSLIQQHGRVAC